MSSSIPLPELKILCMRSGGICAYSGCGRSLVRPETEQDGAVVVANVAHIVADSRQGPRGDAPLTEAERNKYPNLILLCPDHHAIVDAQPMTYSVPVLRQMKADHEARVIVRTPHAPPSTSGQKPKQETVQSTLLPVTHLPSLVFAAPCAFDQSQMDQVRERIVYPRDRKVLVPLVLADGKVFAFQDLREDRNPFARVTDRRHVELLRARDLWSDAEGRRRYVTLLNRALMKLGGRLALRYDPQHRRFFFLTEETGQARSIRYRSLTGKQVSRSVVWQPVKRSTGEVRDFWWHLATNLRFHRLGESSWCLSIRPERHLTQDGQTPLAADRIGRRVARLKARMFNDKYLGEVSFWREYLSQGQPRIILKFGTQAAIVGADLVQFVVTWPGIPGDEKPLVPRIQADDLFSWADLSEALDHESEWEGFDEGDEDWDEDGDGSDDGD